MKEFNGIPVSPGTAIGRAFRYTETILPEITRRPILKTALEAELSRFEKALDAAAAELALLKEKAEREMGRKEAGIFAAHLMMLEDPDFIDMIKGKVEKNLVCSEWALTETAGELTKKMAASGNPVFEERASDINDVSKRVLLHLLSVKRISLANLESDVIIAARELLPSDLLAADRTHIKGIAMDSGSLTSHMAILAKAFNIPAVLGLSSASSEIQTGDEIVLDGYDGKVFVNPSETILKKYREALKTNLAKLDEALREKELPAITLDGCRVTLKANIGTVEEAEQALRFGAEGIGLYRSEFLFIASGKAAEENEQFESYSRVLKAMGKLPVTIRTVDLGGDKIASEFQTQPDRNPLLGWRGIRVSLEKKEIFKVQLRAMLRASVHGNMRIMFPFISGVEELEEALAVLEEAKEECREKGRPFAENIPAGTMIEIPSAALTADILAEKSAFFSIGTNDLVQYTLAVERGNERVNYLARPAHPALIRLVKTTVDAAHRRGIKAAMCGETAGDPLFTPLLLGLGLDELSMSAQTIPEVKKIIRAVSMEECRALAEKVLQSSSSEKNTVMLKKWMNEKFPNR